MGYYDCSPPERDWWDKVLDAEAQAEYECPCDGAYDPPRPCGQQKLDKREESSILSEDTMDVSAPCKGKK